MIRQFFAVWGAIQQLLLQVRMIRLEVKEDPEIIKQALQVYRNLNAVGLTDEQIDNLYKALASGKIDMDLLK